MADRNEYFVHLIMVVCKLCGYTGQIRVVEPVGSVFYVGMSDDDFKIFLHSEGLWDEDYSKLTGIHCSYFQSEIT